MTMLPDLLPIRPFTRPARGDVTLPGSKSITNRALLLAALCDGPVTLTGALFSEDTEIMAQALNKLGIKVKSDAEAKTFHIAGHGGNIPAQTADIFVGNAGTAARFLTALCAAAKSGTYRLDGVPQMRKRPMKGLIDALRSLGADIRCPGEEGFFPLEIHARGLRGGDVNIDASESSQMLSALMMVGPLAAREVVISKIGGVRLPFVQMTEAMMQAFQPDMTPAITRLSDQSIRVTKVIYALPDMSYAIEPDATAASYFLALPLAVTRYGALCLRGFHVTSRSRSLQGDVRFGDIVQGLGCRINSKPTGTEIRFSGLAHRVGNPLHSHEFREFSDTFLSLATITPLLDGPTTITGIAHTRKQETDRVAGMARELTKLGQSVIETEDSLAITPDLPKLRQLASAAVAAGRLLEIETYKDHRFAMSFAILGCYDLLGDGQPWLAIRDPACCAKTFPNFFDVLEYIRQTSHFDESANPTNSP